MYTLVPITSQADADQEGKVLQHAIGALYAKLNEESVLIYSVRQDDVPLLTLSACYDERGAYVCEHVVGLANRAPTPDELDVVRDLLRQRKIHLRHDPTTLGGETQAQESRDWDEVPTPVRRQPSRRVGR